ncbi:synaptobrevin homolog YKT6-like isoform X1 [Biomphalaria glabrata]|uniref:Synaptobrevin homolog YKT6-like isoform X1 n=1 Tax=Biomphalaria glabrata TaxID=6526 RepID=A0A9W3APK5_BIOGL|nr:synaptobrevin homolog YKT6-like isoform X1 [Biomphalaria glabrata]XP_055889094.1 synaptobrevin homolog YKT6-like isoform X1 [Biomphalaria glabrata]XP_055889100.1 synaptobrevin homolog YKT6-like isoform X1 [Biomphalaria glabrata]XP_055889108.1 synaptobrevin homolog YKT6-like isoform X1 [Biomphalaria glabrata]XP_055889113.1 synaptobrevin homolog YKT6-like isoform X1 [Biomphalaria glabrata]XP_055889120.1 synaptobrevin homolog YKT6-like isoform X1 [Biomphalaria glabrata]XP_055889128.1 synaptob
MKLYSIAILLKTPEGKGKILTSKNELSSFGYFQRSTVSEFMVFTSKILVERTATASRASVKEREYICHVYVRSDNLSGVVIADHEYPQRVAHTLINKVLDEFQEKCPKPNWSTIKENEAPYPQLTELLQKYQNPKEADAMTKIQSELDETKIILHNTIEAVLQRGEKLDDLVEKSEGLSQQSKTFYITKKMAAFLLPLVEKCSLI